MSPLLAAALVACHTPPEPAAPVGALVPVEVGDRWGYADATGAVAIPARFRHAAAFNDGGIAWALDDSGPVWIDVRGQVLAHAFLWDNGPDPFQDGLSRVVEGGKYGFIDEEGAIAIRPAYTWVEPFEGGYAAFCQACTFEEHGEHRLVVGGPWGVIDRSGAEEVPATEASAEAARAKIAP